MATTRAGQACPGRARIAPGAAARRPGARRPPDDDASGPTPRPRRPPRRARGRSPAASAQAPPRQYGQGTPAGDRSRPGRASRCAGAGGTGRQPRHHPMPRSAMRRVQAGGARRRGEMLPPRRVQGARRAGIRYSVLVPESPRTTIAPVATQRRSIASTGDRARVRGRVWRAFAQRGLCGAAIGKRLGPWSTRSPTASCSRW